MVLCSREFNTVYTQNTKHTQNTPITAREQVTTNTYSASTQGNTHTHTNTYSASTQGNTHTHGNTSELNVFSVNLLTLNVCGLRSKLLLDEFIELLKKYDVICMCETRCDDVDMKNVKDKIENIGFNIVYKNRGALRRFKSGGLLIAVRNTFNYIWKQTKDGFETLLSVYVNGVTRGMEKNLMITSVYIPPSHSRYGKPEHFGELDDFLLSNNDCYHIVSGDFNAHTGTLPDIGQVSEDNEYSLPMEDIYVILRTAGFSENRCNQDGTSDRNTYGKKLVEVCKNNNAVIFNGRMSDDCGIGKVTTTYNTTIDYVIGSCDVVKFVKVFRILDFDPLFSDVHCGLHTQLEFLCRVRQENKESQQVNDQVCVKPGRWMTERKREYVRNVDISRVHELIERANDLSVDDINQKLKHILIEPALKTFPQSIKKKYIKKSNCANMKGYDKQCYNSRKEYHKAKNKHNRHKSTVTYTAMIEKSKKYKKEIKRVKNKESVNILQQLRENKSKDPKAYWKILKDIKVKKDNQISLDKFYDHFKLLFTEDDGDRNDNINYEINSDNSSPVLNDPITIDEIKKCISKLKNNKSPGVDNIINEYIKCTQDLLCPLYLKQINKNFDAGVFPSEWLTGIIVPLYKNKGDVNDTNNYRGITLVSCMGKLFTCVLNERLKQYSDNNLIIGETQAGFRQEYSTLDHIFLLKCVVELFKWKKKKLFCLFIDYKKAFDMVWREGLWYKLVRDNVNGKILKVIRSMYDNVKSCVMVDQQMTDTFICNMGVRQGENLSPLLFAFYVNDIQKTFIEQDCTYLNFSDEFLNSYLKLLVLMYADDTVILCDSKQSINQALTALYSYCSDWKLKVNCSKTKIVVFSRGKVQTSNYNFLFGGQEVEVVSEYKYLGILFNYNGKFRKGELELKEQATRALYTILGTCRKYDLPVDIQIQMYNSMVVPVMTYACEIWGNETVRELELLQMKFLKHVLYVHRYTGTDIVYGELGVYPLEISIKCRMINYWTRLITGKNTKLSYVMYTCLLQLHSSGVYSSPWLDYIRNICNECGLSGVWLSQTVNNPKLFMKIVEQKLKDLWITTWYGNITTKAICSSYRLYKEVYGIEEYLVRLNKTSRIYLSKLRTGNNQLPVITGRYRGISREERYCDKCNSGQVGDEYHVLFQCQYQHVVQLRNKYIPDYYKTNPNQFKFIMLMQSENVKLLNNLAQFIKEALRLFR